MSGYAISYKTGSPWLGVLAALLGGALLGFIHAWLTQKPNVSDIAVGIAMIIFGSGIAFFLGKPFIQPLAPQLPALKIPLGARIPTLDICPLFLVGVGLAFVLDWFFAQTRWGMFVRAVGDKPDAARALGRYAEGVESNPSRLAEVEERLFRLQKLLRKHGPTTTELLAHRDALKKELDAVGSAGDRAAARKYLELALNAGDSDPARAGLARAAGDQREKFPPRL